MFLAKPSTRRVALAVVLVFAGFLFAFSTEPWFGPNNRFRVIMIAILFNTVAVVWLLSKLFQLLDRLESEHRRTTYVSTARGLVDSLAVAARNGGMPLDARLAIYEAIDDQFNRYDHELADIHQDPEYAVKPTSRTGVVLTS